MGSKSYDVVIIGGGLAGLAAADLLAGHRLRVLLLDENVHSGGQLLRKTALKPGRKTGSDPDRLKRIGFELRDRVCRKEIDIMRRGRVPGIWPDRQLWIEDDQGRVSDLTAEFIILATGAREKFLPFRGWTLPGVISTGAAQILMKSAGVLPARETLIAGLGPLIYILAGEILRNGGRASAVLDRAFPADKIALSPLWLHQIPKLAEGAICMARLLSSKVPLRQRTGIVEARGRRQLESVVTAKVDRDGRFVTGTETVYQTDTLAVGCGFTANTELPRMAGCDLEYRPEKGGWVTCVDDGLETSEKNIYAAGEITGIAGGGKSYVEGQMAALSILSRLGLGKADRIRRQFSALARAREHQVRFGAFLNTLCRISPASYAAIPDDTLICRCEDVTMGQIRQAIRSGAATPAALKKATRSGMGNCQGRTCGPVLHDILGACTPESSAPRGPLSVRAPVKPVNLGALAGPGSAETQSRSSIPCRSEKIR
ncbi:FAD/NAD(P)-binding oxidoreductase [Desulfonema ishimotonii]|uniref:FAD/NAD(P)-binding oxidoreductase n=1 Tax=Desulfonema ishimotonii TaxID=45657 RepID=A0A401G1Y8_9BACT|nr:FAD-dependent oxidoreductase [Desulfonema ishimotonii]GBC63239.1 FAD/NAD(P)-binding oxidoreductase [Desulfonema ishimotonii]